VYFNGVILNTLNQPVFLCIFEKRRLHFYILFYCNLHGDQSWIQKTAKSSHWTQIARRGFRATTRSDRRETKRKRERGRKKKREQEREREEIVSTRCVCVCLKPGTVARLVSGILNRRERERGGEQGVIIQECCSQTGFTRWGNQSIRGLTRFSFVSPPLPERSERRSRTERRRDPSAREVRAATPLFVCFFFVVLVFLGKKLYKLL